MTNGSGPHHKQGGKKKASGKGQGKAKKATTAGLARKTLTRGVTPPAQNQ